ncbi:hypothetical protein ACFLVM_01900 [Chloroflexota bacterium]
MSVPAMYYVGCGFNWLFVLLSLGAYFYILSKTGRKLAFLPIFAAGWAVAAISYLLLIGGAAAGEWYITLIRITVYMLFLATLLTLIVELSRSKISE